MAKSAERQARLMVRKKQAGFVRVQVWLPEHAVAEFRLAAERILEEPGLVIGPLRHEASGKLVPLRRQRKVPLAAV